MTTALQQWQDALGDLVSPGDVIAGKYRLDRIVGVGGMGVVIESHHLELDRPVAVKVLRPERLVKDSSRERFKREARACFSMTSEHVARIIDLGNLDGGGLYMVMELLDGLDFAQLLGERGRLSASTAVGYVLQVCEAVAEAHALGTVHRDLKPDNLFLCRRADGSPCVKVLDFGLAKVVEKEEMSLTRVNRGMGTPRYMSPEQWVSARDVGPPADIWALGVILFELTTGRCPFDAPDVNALCQKVLFSAAPDPAALVDDLPAGFAAVIARCLEKKPHQRFGSVQELVAALLPFAPRFDSPVESLPGGLIDHARPSPGWALSLSERDVIAVNASAMPSIEAQTDTADHSAPAASPNGAPDDDDDAWVEQPTLEHVPATKSRSRGVWLGLTAVLIAAGIAAGAIAARPAEDAAVQAAPAAQPQRAPEPETTTTAPPLATTEPPAAVAEREPSDEEVAAEEPASEERTAAAVAPRRPSTPARPRPTKQKAEAASTATAAQSTPEADPDAPRPAPRPRPKKPRADDWVPDAP